MLPINLLPSSYGDKDKKTKALVGAVVMTAIAAGLMFFLYSKQVGEYNLAVDRKNTADGYKTKYDAQVAEINKVKAKIADTQTKQTFVANAQKYNDAWPVVFDLVRNLAAPGVLLKQPDVTLKTLAFSDASHKTLHLTGFAASEDAMYHWWKELKKRNDIFDNVRFEYLGRPFNPGGGTSASGMGGSAGMPGGKGMGGPMAGGPMTPGMPGSGGPMAGGPMTPGMPGSGGMPGGGGGGGNDGVGPASVEGRPVYNFVATLVLKQPMDEGAAAPTWPAGAPAVGGAPGGFPGSGGPVGGKGAGMRGDG